ncbi:MAG TPA: HPF/RaiA family ribosome-associated protein [Eudoraea sp.]|nr:HPF/RaiA family ribosome-associated protein [Eudoraea sp.]
MTIHIQYQHMPASESLSKIITRNLHKLAHKYQFLIRAEVSLKLGNGIKGNDKVCEMEISAPGPRLFAKSSGDDFEKAAAETLSELERQLRKRKAKFRRSNRTI